MRVAPALRAALVDDTIAGWQLNAANGRGPPKGTGFWSGTQAFLAREAAARTRFPVDFFTIQNYKGASSAELAANSRAALCAEAGGARPASGCSLRFAMTPVVFVRFDENKDVDPNYDHKSGEPPRYRAAIWVAFVSRWHSSQDGLDGYRCRQGSARCWMSCCWWPRCRTSPTRCTPSGRA